jgi:chromosome segregation ATPase
MRRGNMTSEEIEQTLQRVAVAIEHLTQAAVRADKRQDDADSARREADERIEALINAQVRYEARHERLEEAFRQVAASQAQLVEMLQLHEDRLDGQDEANVHTESRLDALIDSQIRLTERVDTLTRDIAAVNGRAAATDERLDRMAGMIESLTQAQARTDEQIRTLVERNGGSAQ